MQPRQFMSQGFRAHNRDGTLFQGVREVCIVECSKQFQQSKQCLKQLQEGDWLMNCNQYSGGYYNCSRDN